MAALKKAKTGSLTYFPRTTAGQYEFDGGKKQLLICEEKYFAQINPHNQPAPTDQEICDMFKGRR